MAHRSKPMPQTGHFTAFPATILDGRHPAWPRRRAKLDEKKTAAAAGRRPSARDAKRMARAAQAGQSVPYITRRIPCYEVLGEEGLALIENNADTILEEIGIEFREDP